MSVRSGRGRRIGLAGLALVVGAAVAVGLSTTPPGTPPAYAGHRPEPADSGYVSHTESVFVAVPSAQDRAWGDAPGRDLGDVVEAADGMPPVVATQPVRGDWDPAGDRTGDRRRVQFADGHFLAEEVLADTPERFRYVIWGFTGYQRFAVQYAVAEFAYTERPGGMQLTWTYSFRPTAALLRPFVAGFVDGTIAPMMRGTLAGMRSGAEGEVAR